MGTTTEREGKGGGSGRSFARGAPPTRAVAVRAALWLLAAGLAVGVVFGQLGENGLFAWRHLDRQERQLRQEAARLAADNEAMAERLKTLVDDKDPFALEKIAREEYGMIAPGEQVLQVLPADRDSTLP